MVRPLNGKSRRHTGARHSPASVPACAIGVVAGLGCAAKGSARLRSAKAAKRVLCGAATDVQEACEADAGRATKWQPGGPAPPTPGNHDAQAGGSIKAMSFGEDHPILEPGFFTATDGRVRESGDSLEEDLEELGLDASQLLDVIRYAFARFDEDGDGQLSFEEFFAMSKLVGLDLKPATARRAFLKLSKGQTHFRPAEFQDDLWNQVSLGLTSMMEEQAEHHGLVKALYVANRVGAEVSRDGMVNPANLPEKIKIALESTRLMSDFIFEVMESVLDLAGIALAVTSIFRYVGCGNDCPEVEWSSLLPVALLVRKMSKDAFGSITERMADDLTQEESVAFARVFKPAGFSLAQFRDLCKHGEAKWRHLPAGATIPGFLLEVCLLVVGRGVMKLRTRSVVPGLTETSETYGPGSFLGTECFWNYSLVSRERKSTITDREELYVLEDTMVLVLRNSDQLRQYLEVQSASKRAFQVAVTRAMAKSAADASQYARRTTQELRAFLSDATLGIQQKFNVDRAVIWVHDADTKVLWTTFQTGDGKNKHIEIDDSHGIPGHCFTHWKTLNIADCYKDARHDAELDRRDGYRTESTLCLPLALPSVAGGKSVGVLQLCNKVPAAPSSVGRFAAFTRADEERAQHCASLTCTVALQASMTYSAQKMDV